MAGIKIEPDKTFAIVVGIDRYPRMEDLNLEWRLNNAVAEAFEFTQWLLDQGLHADQVKLFVSGGEDQRTLTDGAGQTVTQQDPGGVEHAIREQSFNLASDQNLLFVYWAGHGYTDQQRQHQLLFDQNYNRGNDRRVYDLDDVKQALRSEYWCAFPRQIILVNACGKDSSGEFNRHQFNGLPMSGQINRKQFTICSASPGEYAWDGTNKEPSEFFKLLLKTLQAQTRGHRPLNLAEVCNSLCQEAEKHGQTPRIEWINWNGSRYVWSNDALLKLIYSKVSKCGIAFGQLTESYQKCVEDAESIGSIKEMIAHLNGARKNRKQTTRYGPVLDFALHLIQLHALDDLDRELKEFFQKEADYEMPLLIDAREKIAKKYRRPVAPLYLSIIPGEAGDTFSFYLHDSHRWEMVKEDFRVDGDETLETAFHRVFHDYENNWKDSPDDLHFHFFLRVEGLFLGLHEWKDPTRFSERHRLEDQHRVALRCLERAKGTAPIWAGIAGRWRNKAQKIKNRNSPCLRINWLDPQDGGCDFNEVAEEHDGAGFHSRPSVDVLRDALQEGLPFLIWPRRADQQITDWDACRAAIDAVQANGGPHGAQAFFPRLRRQHWQTPFAVLWDDPDHNPYSQGVPGALNEAAQHAAPPPFPDIA